MKKLTLIISYLTFIFSVTVIGAPMPLDGIAAVVNDAIITKNELSQQIKIAAKQIQQEGNHLPPQTALEKQVLDQLILNEVQVQMAKKTGIQVDDSQLDNTIENIAKQNHMTLTQLREALSQENIEFDRYRSNIRHQMIVTQLQQRDLMHDVQVSEQEVTAFLRSPNGMGNMLTEYRLGHILVSLPDAPSPETLTETSQKVARIISELRQGKDFAELAMTESGSEQALKGGDLGWRKLPELPTLFEGVVPGLKINEIPDAIRSSSGYHIIKLLDKRNSQENAEAQQTLVRHLLIKTNAMTSDLEAKQRLNELRSKILKGEDFAKIAKTHSTDLGTANKGGNLGWVTKDVLVHEFNQVMENLALLEISEPFKTSFGWHIVQVMDRKSQTSDDASVRQNAKNMLMQRKFEEKQQAWSRQVRDEAYVKTFI